MTVDLEASRFGACLCEMLTAHVDATPFGVAERNQAWQAGCARGVQFAASVGMSLEPGTSYLPTPGTGAALDALRAKMKRAQDKAEEARQQYEREREDLANELEAMEDGDLDALLERVEEPRHASLDAAAIIGEFRAGIQVRAFVLSMQLLAP